MFTLYFESPPLLDTHGEGERKKREIQMITQISALLFFFLLFSHLLYFLGVGVLLTWCCWSLFWLEQMEERSE